MVSRGEWYYFDFPFPIKRRPVIIVSRSSGRKRCLVVPISESEPKREQADIVAVTRLSVANQLKGFVHCEEITLLPVAEIDPDNRMGRLSDADMDILGSGLRFALGLIDDTTAKA